MLLIILCWCCQLSSSLVCFLFSKCFLPHSLLIIYSSSSSSLTEISRANVSSARIEWLITSVTTSGNQSKTKNVFFTERGCFYQPLKEFFQSKLSITEGKKEENQSKKLFWHHLLLTSILTIKTTGYGECIGDTQVVSESFWLIIGDIGTLIQSSDSQTMPDK